MRVLAVSDRVLPHLYTPLSIQRFGGIDLIVACGDLPAEYLEYLLTQLNVPLLFVPGNHDPDSYSVPGGTNVDGKVVSYQSCLIMGLGGSRRYKPIGRHQYTEMEMRARMLRNLPRLALNRIRHGRALDVLITHAPPRGIHDAEDPAHVGFTAFLEFIRFFQPSFMLHGHTHRIANLETFDSEYTGCRIINVYPSREVDVTTCG